MQLNELLEQYSIKEISTKTRIAPENLEYLHGRDWDMMRKVQALGFINILEREYGIDLSDLRKECLAYYSEHSQGLGGEHLELHFEENSTNSIVNILKKVAISIFIVMLAVGSWYVFVRNGESQNSENTVNAKNGFYNSVMNMANKLMKESNDTIKSELASEDESEINISKNKSDNGENKAQKDSVADKNIITDTNSNEKIKLEYAKKPEETASTKENNNKDNNTKTAEANNKKEKKENSEPLKITDVIPTVTTEKVNDAKKEDNTDNISDNFDNTDSSTADKTDESNNNKDNIDDTSSMVSLLPEVPSLSTEKKSETQKDKTDTTKNSDTQEQKATDGASVVVMEPGSKVWIGFRELRSGKRTAEVVTKPVKFDTKGSDYILATGHGVLTFKNGNDKELLKLHDGKKHFFMIAKGGVREISHEKFQKLNGSKVW